MAVLNHECYADTSYRNSLQCSPSAVWVEFGHRFCEIGGIFAEVLSVDHPILIDDERLNAALVVFCRVGNVGESAGRFSVDDIRFRASFGSGALTIEVVEVVTVKRLGGIGRESYSLFAGECDQRPNGATRRILRRLPVQTVLLAGIANEFLCVLFQAAMLLSEVLLLGLRQSSACVNGHDLVAANAA